MDELPAKIIQFIELAGGNCQNYNNILFFMEIVHAKSGKNETLVEFTCQNPEIITEKVKNNIVFDYFFEKIVQFRDNVDIYDFWLTSLLKVLSESLKDDDNIDVIMCNPMYINKLQSSNRSHTMLFQTFIDCNFEMGDPKLLAYSLVARGELDKLKILRSAIPVEKYKGIMAAAVKYGRYEIVDYLLTVNSDIDYYGRILDLEYFEDDPKYMYYHTTSTVLSLITMDMPPIIEAKQDYARTLDLILEQYAQPITTDTLSVWCTVVRNRMFEWDMVNFAEILDILRPQIDKPIPLVLDFGEFNSDVFGFEWSDRKCIIEQYMHVQSQLDNLREQYNILLDKFNHLIDKE